MVERIDAQVHIRSRLFRDIRAISRPDDSPGHFQVWRATDGDDQLWIVKLSKRWPSESLAHYAVRCWHEGLVQARLGRLAQDMTLKGIPAAQLVPLELPHEPNTLLRDALQEVELFDLDKVLSDKVLEKPYPLWGVAYPMQPGSPLIPDRKASASPPLSGKQILELGQTLAYHYTQLRKHGFFYLPVGSHILLQDGKPAAFTGLGHGIHLTELASGPKALRRFADGLYDVSRVPDTRECDLLQLEWVSDHIAMQSFGYLLYNLVWSHGKNQSGHQDREITEQILRIGNMAWRGLPIALTLQDRPLSDIRYHSWEDLMAELHQLASPGTKPIRVGIVLDYANTMTGLSGWDLDLAGLSAQFDSYREGKRVVYRCAAVVETPENPRDVIKARLESSGFAVETVSSPTREANQADDQKLMEIMAARARQIDELVLITSDGDYAATLRALKQKGIKTRIVHFSPLSQKYIGLVDEIIPGIPRFRRYIRPGMRWGHRSA